MADLKIKITYGEKEIEMTPSDFIQGALVELNKKVDIPFLNEEQEQKLFNKAADIGTDLVVGLIFNKFGE